MKPVNLFIALAVLAGVAFGQPSRGPASVRNPAVMHLGNEGKVWPALRESLDSGRGGSAYLIHIDTSEIDTGYILFNVLGSPIFTSVDTVGVFSFTCKDSTGTDTTNIVGKWQGNPRCDSDPTKGVWENVDSVTYVGATSGTATPGTPASSAYSNKSKVVVNNGGYCRMRFLLRNPFTTAARKATCKDAVLIERPRAGYRP